MIPMKTIERASVVENKEIAREIFNISLRLQKPVTFKPGQFLVFNFSDKPKVRRSYSIAGKKGDELSFIFKRVEDGVGTNYLVNLKPGDQVQTQGPFGQFILRQNLVPKLFLATGVGLSVFPVMFDALFETNPQATATLLFGVRYADEIFLTQKLKQLAQTYPNFDYKIAVSRPDQDWAGERGRIIEHLESVSGLAERECYLCGSQAMIKEVSQLLQEKGVPRERILSEKYY